MIFEWDDGTAASNLAKHGVSFELARKVWSDPLYLILPDRVEGGEQRWHAIGMVGAVVVLVVVHNHPNRTTKIGSVSLAPEKLRHTKGNAMRKKVLSAELQDQLDRLAALPDDQIDTTDIPEASGEAWQHARRPGLYRPLKKPVTLRLDADIVSWFKEHANDHGYQTEINRVLRRYVAESEART